jgi:hypothetical protein
MVFNATYNNISVISWWSALLAEETRGPRETTDLPQATDPETAANVTLSPSVYIVEYSECCWIGKGFISDLVCHWLLLL